MAQEQAQIQEAQSLRDTFATMMPQEAAPVATPSEPVVTTPVVETPIATPETPVTPIAETPKTLSFEEQLAERSGGKWKSLDDIKPEVKEVVKEPEFKSEFLKKMYEYTEKNGGDVEDFLKIHSTNWDNVDAATLVKEQMKAENPKLTSEEVDKLFDYTYKQSEDNLDTDKEIGALRLKTEAEKVREAKKKFQAENTVPKNKIEAEQQAKLAQEKQAKWEQGVSETLKDTKISQSLKLEDGTVAGGLEISIDHVLDNAEQEQMRTILNNPNTIFNKYLTKDGGVDMGGLKRDMYVLQNLDRVLAKTAENAISTFIKKDLKNADFNPAAKVPPANADLKTEAEKRLANYLS